MELHLRDKFEQDSDILLLLLEHLEDHPKEYERVALALAEAKKVRRTCTLLIQQLAEQRDNLQPGGTR